MIVSIHIPRTAGTALQKCWLKLFSKNGIFLDYNNSTYNAEMSVVEKINTNLIKVVQGHFAISKYKIVFPYAKYTTVFREPFSQVLSHYKFLQQSINCCDKGFPDWFDKRMSFEEFFEKPQSQNYQSTFLNGYSIFDFDYIGITEKFTDYLRLIYQVVKAQFNEKDHDIRINQSKTIGSLDGDKYIKRVLELNSEDVELYRKACEIVEKRQGYVNT